MENVWRAIIHDVAEVAGLVSHSFGEEGVDKHTVIFKMVSLQTTVIQYLICSKLNIWSLFI